MHKTNEIIENLDEITVCIFVRKWIINLPVTRMEERRLIISSQIRYYKHSCNFDAIAQTPKGGDEFHIVS